MNNCVLPQYVIGTKENGLLLERGMTDLSRHLGEKIRESEGLGRAAGRAEPVGPTDQPQVRTAWKERETQLIGRR
jgi:hypothetical protein